MSFGSMRTQYFPPAPTFTEKDIGRQDGKVFVVTGGNQGVGLELIKMLYPTGATIYMASRSEERAQAAIKEVTSVDLTKASHVKFLHLDLADLNSVRSAAAAFAEQESRLDILWNNAGVGGQPVGSKTKQGIEMHMGVNVIGPLLFTELLLPQIKAAAASSPKDSVRIIWTSSWMTEGGSPKGGFVLEDLKNGGKEDAYSNYATSKASNWIIANEAANRWGKDGIISVSEIYQNTPRLWIDITFNSIYCCTSNNYLLTGRFQVVQNPGNLQTHIYDTQPRLMMFFVNMILYPPKHGAYTELFAGLSPEITEKHQGAYIIPWGRIQPRNPREDIYEAIESGKGKELWDWCDEQIKAHA
jgi:NAD(P)-dependent dehydrogenase (short-subunit alcohol dehydrogenase family)